MPYSKLTANSLNVLVLRFGGVGLMFFLSLFLTNYYSADLVGQYDFVRSTMMILSGISILGTDQAIIYYSGILTSDNSTGQLKKIYFKMIALIFMICVILYIPILLPVWWSSAETKKYSMCIQISQQLRCLISTGRKISLPPFMIRRTK